MAAEIVAFLVILSVFAAFGLGSVVLAARSAPWDRRTLVRRRPAVWVALGGALAATGHAAGARAACRAGLGAAVAGAARR
ncbi:hypothetical protein ACQPZZ_21020 [Microbispora sp. CA-135349]|uniref:hypothetical protein n=1 Tax=Microbispora sp. CA-135349 TaxID=3239953 RepID=UPI003D8FDF83